MSAPLYVPDYYLKFACKCAECRNVCCGGWGINISEYEYYSLLGINCSKELRKRLDFAFELRGLADSGSFARIRPNYTGSCPMLDSDGYCMLQKECGEDMLPLVCRLYPRSVKFYGGHYEMCTSNSCEKTVELLFADTAPLKLAAAPFRPPFCGIKMYDTDPAKDGIRYESLRIMQDRSLSFAERLKRLGMYICAEDSSPESSGTEALRSMRDFIRAFEDRSSSILDCGEKALKYIGGYDDEAAYEMFRTAESRLYSAIPDIEVFAEKLTVNHMLYEGFPFVPDSKTVKAAYSALCLSAAILKFICVLGLAESVSESINCGGKNSLPASAADLMSETYRFIEHSGFYSIYAGRPQFSGMITFDKLSPVIA